MSALFSISNFRILSKKMQSPFHTHFTASSLRWHFVKITSQTICQCLHQAKTLLLPMSANALLPYWLFLYQFDWNLQETPLRSISQDKYNWQFTSIVPFALTLHLLVAIWKWELFGYFGPVAGAFIDHLNWLNA